MVLEGPIATLRQLEPRGVSGSIAAVRGLTVLVEDLPLPVGTLVRVEPRPAARAGSAGSRPGAAGPVVRGEIVGFDAPHAIVMLYASGAGTAPGMRVVGEQSAQTVAVGEAQLGRVVDGLGRPLDGRGAITDTVMRPLNPPPTTALRRRRIDEPLPTGVRAIDAMLTLGKGQRAGIFAGPGVGKSTLLASVARNTTADVNVIGLVGERGREVREFIESALGPEGLARSVIVVATGDESPLLRVRAAFLACSVAEHFRDQGADVMLMMDSVTRFAQAQRQIGLAVGEQPATKGYTPTVFAMLPVLLERAGAVEGGGSITGLYAVLVEGDDLTEPVSDAVRGILDGHIALSRRLAARGHYPAIDVLESVSRVADGVCDEHHVRARRRVARVLAARAASEELITIGAYAAGSDVDTDVAIALRDEIDALLQQDPGERAAYPNTCRALIELAARIEATASAAPRS